MARRAAPTATDGRARIDLSGPFFQPDADKRFRENVRGMLGALAEEGDRVVTARAPRKTGALASGIVGRTQAVSGRRWALTAVVSATHVYPWANKGARGYSGRSEADYRGGKAERKYGMFRSATYQMRQARAVLAANLTAGLE